MKRRSILWFREDLRLDDNPALVEAAKDSEVIPVFIWSEGSNWPMGAASRWWLHHSLLSLDASLRLHGSRLILRKGNPLDELHAILRETGAQRICFNRRYTPFGLQQDAKVENALKNDRSDVHVFSNYLLFEPWTIKNKSGAPFRVFTPFWKACLAEHIHQRSCIAPSEWTSPPLWPKSLAIEDLALLPKLNWANRWLEFWSPGERGAQSQLKHFIENAFFQYDQARDLPSVQGTSRLSAHLHFGEISVRKIWDSIHQAAEKKQIAPATWQKSQFITELGWREFAYHLLHHFPETPHSPLKPAFDSFQWNENKDWQTAWQKGKTGFPIVDAGMRELWQTGWMHNRVRMITASFLVKDLLQPWQMGARWFWDTLVDADLASNTLGWQWSAGCGADAQPFFRIFNPVLQGEKFDADGTYVRKWVPELSKLPNVWIHKPWKAPDAVIQNAGVELENDYPRPIVRHEIAREVAMEALRKIKPA